MKQIIITAEQLRDGNLDLKVERAGVGPFEAVMLLADAAKVCVEEAAGLFAAQKAVAGSASRIEIVRQ